jgi:hypothetical protein
MDEEELNDSDELEFRRLLARHDEPALLRPESLRLALPSVAPQRVRLREQQRRRRRLIGQGALAALVGVMLALGAWSVLVDSTLHTRLLGGSGLDRLLLVLTLLAKPLLATIAANGPATIVAGLLLLVVGGALWWLWLRQLAADTLVQVRR